MTDKERADQMAAELAELKAKQADTATASAAAVKADRERRDAVMALDETKGREKLAERLAKTEMSIDDIKATLADAPTAVATDDTAELEQRRLNAEGLNGGGKKPGAQLRVDIVANMKRRFGVKA